MAGMGISEMACQIKYGWNGCILQYCPVGALENKTSILCIGHTKKHKQYLATKTDKEPCQTHVRY